MLHEKWSLSPYTLVRTTGFPFELLDTLNCYQTAAALDANLVDKHVEALFADELVTVMRHLQDISSRADFREALFLSSPGAFARLHVPSPGTSIRSEDRKRLRHLVLYLQRVTTKCDTNSFFGPTWWGSLGQCKELINFSAPELFSVSSRYVLWTHWAVNAVAQAISSDSDVQARLRLRLKLGLALYGNHVWLTDFVATPPETKEPLLLCEGEVRMLAKCMSTLDGFLRTELIEDDSSQRAALDALLSRGLLHSEIEVPSGLEQPMNWLIEYMQTFPAFVRDRWLPVLAELEETRVRYTCGDLEIRQREQAHMNTLFESVCNRTATRGEGTFYSDRSLLCEEAVRNWQHCDLGEPFLANITAELLPTLYVLLESQSRRHRLRQAAAATWFDTAFPGESEVPLLRLLAAADNDERLEHAFEQVEEEIATFSSELTLWFCQGDPTRQQVEIDSQMMRTRAEGVKLLPCVVNPDVMIGATSVEAANKGNYFLVLGEAHTMQDLIVRVSYATMHPDKEAAVAATARQYARILPNVTVAEPVMEHTDKTKITLPHSLLQIEFGGRAPEYTPTREDALPSILRAGDLWVRRDGDTLCLTATGIPSIVLTRAPVWSPFNRSSVLNIFASLHSNRLEGQIYRYPLGCPHFPRITVGRLVIHRETWWLTPQPAWKKVTGYSLDLWRDLRRWREEHGLPEQVFARFRDEPKPVFVDFRNPLLVDWFIRKIATAQQSVQVTEVLPKAKDLWLHDAQGHYCCEFRMTMYLDGNQRGASSKEKENRGEETHQVVSSEG